jgi:hypothetical protein
MDRIIAGTLMLMLRFALIWMAGSIAILLVFGWLASKHLRKRQ